MTSDRNILLDKYQGKWLGSTVNNFNIQSFLTVEVLEQVHAMISSCFCQQLRMLMDFTSFIWAIYIVYIRYEITTHKHIVYNIFYVYCIEPNILYILAWQK